MTAFSVYLNAIETALAHRQATEHTYRPALNTLIDSLAPGVSATNEPRHVECGAPDFLIAKTGGQGLQVIGYIETKEVGATLDQEERKDQMKRYLGALRNLILTDYLEFRWYVDGSLRRSASLGRLAAAGKFIKNKEGSGAVQELLTDFISHAPQPITTPHELAQRMARLAHLIRDAVVQSFQTGGASSLLNGWREAFARTLIAGLDQPERVGEFADMFSQTLAYGLFSARIMDLCPGFTLAEAQRLIPKTNPFLRRFFYEITGLDLEDEPFYGYVNDLVDLLEHTDMPAVLADFGKRTRKDDPVVHFYETFLAAYDPKLRELRGVYFTPQPVVDFIVRAVDHLLKTRFNLPQGLADAAPALPVKNAGGGILPRLLILDPAAGTGTFLYTVIDFIRQGFMQAGNAGLWQGYVRAQLLPRLYGFELLMAPYAVAHFKLALQLAALDLPPEQRQAWSYDFAANERLNVFLTNTLEEPHEYGDLPLFMQTLAEETRQANRVKDKLPIMVVLGNPPYSVTSSNTGKWITDLVRDSYYPRDEIREANPKMLLDDYVKFIRWAQWRIEQTGSGILAFITNNSYLDSPIFRGMRQNLMKTFDEIYILDLHGNAKKKETAPDGGKDENVFDIQQGVAIGIFTKYPASKFVKTKTIQHMDLYGLRSKKYEQLFDLDINKTPWKTLTPQAPFFLFKPQNTDLLPEYETGWKITDIFPVNSSGIKTHRDHFALDFDRQILVQRIQEFRDLSIEDESISKKYDLPDTQEWKLHLRRKNIVQIKDWQTLLIDCHYRPFDIRSIFYSSDIIDRPRPEIMSHIILGDNMAMGIGRQGLAVSQDDWDLLTCFKQISDVNYFRRGGVQIFPLYLYSVPKEMAGTLFAVSEIARLPNLAPKFAEVISVKLEMLFIKDGEGNLVTTFGPEDIFHYIYAIFHSPTYRRRYIEFLKMDFPRVPLTSSLPLFRALCALGKELIALHLLEAPKVNQFITSYPISGDNRVEKGCPRYVEGQGRVFINPAQYFEGVPPQVWQFHIGGYQVLEKWLKDRRGRQLTYADLTHYQKVVVALAETIRLMAEVDKAIPEWPIQ